MRRSRFAAAGALLWLIPIACGSDAGLTEGGKGYPELSIDFPEAARASETARAVLTVSNPGPGDIDTVAVAFATIAPSPGTREFPIPIVGIGSGGENPTVLEVSPEPRAVSDDGVVYTFEGIEEGDSTSITFTLKMPVQPGIAANSVQVYDGRDIERARGIRLQTTVEG
jgi:hypothetical protein